MAKTSKRMNPKGKEGFKNDEGHKDKSSSPKRGGSYKNNVTNGNRRNSGYTTGDLESNFSNDIEWYNKYPNMFNDATRVPFNKIAGKMYEGVQPDLSNKEGNIQETMGTYNQPGIITMDYVPGIGVTTGFNSAPNRAFKSLWSALYSKTTGIINFPVHILASMYCVQQSIAQNIAYVKRALEISNTYIANNHNFPKYLLLALGLNPESILGKQDAIRWRLNNYIREFNAMMIPKYIDIFVRHYRMARHVYMDQPSDVAQLFMFRPFCYYVYSDKGRYDASLEDYDGVCRAEALVMPYLVLPDTDNLNAEPDTNHPVDIDAILDVIEEQLISVVQSDDYIQVLGAMQRAFDTSQFIVLDEVTADDKVTVKVDDYINYQIHNANFAGRPLMNRVQMPNIFDGTKWAMVDGAIESNKTLDLITYTPSTSGRNCNAFKRAFLNTFNDSVDQAWTAEATRLICILEEDSAIEELFGITYKKYYMDSCGSEFITDMRVWLPTTHDGVRHFLNSGVCTDTSTEVLDNLIFLGALTKFKYAPRVWLLLSTVNQGFVGDIHFWTSIDRDTIRGLNETCLLSQLSTTTALNVKQGIPV